MGDLKTYWTNPAKPDEGIEGQGILESGNDPNITLGGDGALDPLWANPLAPTPEGRETPNSVSGLPLEPTRWEPSDNPPAPPSLEDRNPGTIDQQ